MRGPLVQVFISPSLFETEQKHRATRWFKSCP